MESEITGKVGSLRDALNALDPERHLQTAGELDRLFVARPDTPIHRLKILLESTAEPQKILFSGHRGSGKSTELSKLTEELADQFTVIRYSAQSILNPDDVTYVDVVLSIGLQLFETAAEIDAELDGELREDVVEDVLQFTQDLTREVVTESKSGVSGSGELNFLVGKLSSKISTEDTTRTTIRQRVETRISDLLETIHHLSKELERATERRILMIVEDLDKADLDTAKSLFHGHPRPLREPSVSVIYTFPIALQYDDTYMQVRNNFHEIYLLPNIKTEERDGSPYESGIEMVEDIVRRRLEDDLIEPEALNELALFSSGIPRELIALGRQAALEAITEEKKSIDCDAVEAAAQRRRRDYDILLSQEQRDLLADVRSTKDIDNRAPYRELLHNLSVLQYTNGDDPWYDVHPLARHLIPD